MPPGSAGSEPLVTTTAYDLGGRPVAVSVDGADLYSHTIIADGGSNGLASNPGGCIAGHTIGGALLGANGLLLGALGHSCKKRRFRFLVVSPPSELPRLPSSPELA